MSEIHPSLFDIVPSVARVVHRRFHQYVEAEDIKQECYAFASSKRAYFKEMLDEENVEVRQANERRVAWQIKRAAERYARKEKAARLGYQTADEAFYDVTSIANVLSLVIASVLKDTPLEQGQVMVDDGTPKRPSVPAEGNNLLAMLVDIKNAYVQLQPEDQQVLERRYYDGWTLQQIAGYLEVSISTADRKCSTAMFRLQEFLGGQTPYA